MIMLLAVSPCMAGQYPDKAKRKVLQDFNLGLYNTQSTENIPDGSASDIWNWWIDGKGLSKPGGYIVAGSTGVLSAIYFLDVLYKSDGSKEYIVSDNATVLATKDFRTYTTLRTGLNDLYDLDSAKARFKIWMTNGFDSAFTYDGTTVTVLNGNTYNSGTTPNVPRGKFIEYYDGRFWVYNTTANNSNLNYSSLDSTSTASIPPDHELAWPLSNSLSISQGDGQQGTFLKISGGRLIAGKERSIYSIESLFGSDTLYFPRKSAPDVGFVSKKSVIGLDDVLYGQGEDGLYFYSGGKTGRITDHMNDDVLKFRKDVTRVVSNVWDTQSDFLRGQFSGATVTANGTLMVISSVGLNEVAYNNPPSVDGSDGRFASSNTVQLEGTRSNTTASTFTAYIDLTSANVSGIDNFVGFISSMHIYMRLNEDQIFPTSPFTMTERPIVSIRNKNDGSISSGTLPISSEFNYDETDFRKAPVTFTKVSSITINELLLSSIQVKIEYTNPTPSAFKGIQLGSPSISGLASVVLGNTTGQFISDVATISTDMTAWSLFNSNRNTNGGNINFFYKTATSAVNIATYPYIAINAGTIINSSATDTRIQWATTMTLANINSNIPEIDDVEIEHLEGNSSATRSFGASWKNRLWVGVSTESTGNYPILYVKNRNTSKNPIGFTRLNIPLRSMLVDGNVFYGGAASTGIVYRLDYGTNYNGSAIPSTYETKDFSFSDDDVDPFTLKDLWEYQIEVEQNPNASFTVGTSIEGGAFNTNTFSIDGTGRTIRTINGVNGGGTNRTHGKQFKFRFYNAGLDETPVLNMFSVIYKPTQIRN